MNRYYLDMDKVMVNGTGESLCKHQELDNGIHQFTFFADDRSAVDEWAAHIEQLQINGKWYGKGVMRLLLDSRASGQLPMRYLFECLSDYNREYEHLRLKAPEIRMAYVHDDSIAILEIFNLFAGLMPVPTQARFFSDHEIEAAKVWLLADE